MAVQEKCVADSTSRDYKQSGLIQILELCLNLCLLRWLKPSDLRPKEG